jgi:hypothetical protein
MNAAGWNEIFHFFIRSQCPTVGEVFDEFCTNVYASWKMTDV